MSVGVFKVLKELGSGAFGVVYQAFDSELHRDVALKFPRFLPDVDSPQWQRFLIEARAAARLQHPNICAVHQVVTDPGQPYIVMHYVQGESLKSVLKRRRRFSPADVAGCLSKVAAALAYAHGNGVIHRDIKPDNILIREDGEPMLMDFGMARVAASDAHLTATGDILGTPAYMSPEQGQGRPDDIGPATDIYSLGVLMYEMLCGRLPFRGTVYEVISQIANVQPQPPSALFEDVNAALEAICLKAMAKRIEDRFASMTDLQSALDRYPQTKTTASVAEMSDDSVDAETMDGRRATTIKRDGEIPSPLTSSPEETLTAAK